MAELTVPQIDFSSLGQLPELYRQGQQKALQQQTLASLGQGGQADATALLKSGDLSLAQLGIALRNRQEDQARQAAQDARLLSNDKFTHDLQMRQLALSQRTADRLDDTTPKGFQKQADGSFAPFPGGPQDPSYQARVAAETANQTATQRAAVAREYGIDPASPQGKAFILTGKLPEQDTSFMTAVEQRKAVAQANGLDPSSPGFQSFVLTGKMPREDAQPLTAGDKEAIRAADDAVLSNRSAIDSLNRAKQLSKAAFSGPYADKRGYAASFLGESSDTGKAGIATENLTNEVMTNALGQLKSIFGGNPTEGERKILLDLQGSVSKPDSVRQAIFDRAVSLAQKRLEYNQKKADELRGNTYYKPKTQGQAAPPESAAPADPLGIR